MYEYIERPTRRSPHRTSARPHVIKFGESGTNRKFAEYWFGQERYVPSVSSVAKVSKSRPRRATDAVVIAPGKTSHQPKMLSGIWKATTQLGASTISAIFKSPAVLQMQ